MRSCRRDPVLRRQRREARAEARADLRARYLAWREHWRKPELRYSERCREIHQACRLRKSHIRVQYDDPVLRKLHYHIAEVQRMQALIRLKEEVRDERQKLIAEGKWYPPSYRQWVEAQAAQGDRAAVSQLRGWDYRDRRKDKSRTTTADRCVILCEPGGTPVYENRGIWRRACRKTAVSGSAIAGLINLSARIMVTGWYSIIIMTVTNWQINWI